MTIHELLREESNQKELGEILTKNGDDIIACDPNSHVHNKIVIRTDRFDSNRINMVITDDDSSSSQCLWVFKEGDKIEDFECDILSSKYFSDNKTTDDLEEKVRKIIRRFMNLKLLGV